MDTVAKFLVVQIGQKFATIGTVGERKPSQ